MNGLYKGKYIIAIYDKNGFLIDVGCSPSEIKCYKNNDSIRSIVSKMLRGERPSERVVLIDVTEKHDDVFAEEDQLFLNFVNNTKKKTNKEKAKELGISERTYYKHKASQNETFLW